MRLLAALLVLALSGVANAGAPAQRVAKAEADKAEADKAAPCDDCGEGCDDDCSPLCSDCVCTFGARSMPSSPPLLGAPHISTTMAGPAPVSPTPPPAPDLGDVFHPPRA